MTWNMSKGLLVFVCGLALLGLAACGGGGGGGGKPDRYGSLALGSNYGGAIRPGGSRSAARSAAVAACSGLGGTNCREVLWFRNACGAVAQSSDDSRAGAGWGTSKAAAETKAIAACHATGGKTCRVDTATSGSPFSACYTGGSSPAAGQASVIAPRAEARIMPSPPPSPAPAPSPAPSVQTWYGVAIAREPGNTVWSIATGASSQAAARTAALADCRARGGRQCSSIESYNSCYAIAQTSAGRSYSVAGRPTQTKAENDALAGCHGYGQGTCHISTGDRGRAASGCVGIN